MYIIGQQAIGECINPTSGATETFNHYYNYRIDWLHKSGGMKKSMYYGMKDVPIKKFEFEENKLLVGTATIEMIYIDFPLHAEDKVRIYKNNELKWSGILTEIPELVGGKVKLNPVSSKFKKRYITKTYIGKTIAYMFQNIIETHFDSNEVSWNASKVDTGESTTYDMQFKGITVEDAFKKLQKKLVNRQYGVDVYGDFVIYQPNSTLDKILDKKIFASMKEKTNASKIKSTRYIVYRKNAAGQIVECGRVGDDIAGGDYPTLSIETIIGQKDGKFTVSTDLTGEADPDGLAKDWAYADLLNNSVLKKTITLKDFRRDDYNVSIGDYCRVMYNPERLFHLFLDNDKNQITDTVTGWSDNVLLYSDDYVSGTASIKMIGSNSTDSVIYYDFGEIKRYAYLEKLCFMVQSDLEDGNILEFGMADTVGDLWLNPYQIYIEAQNVWELKNIYPTETTFRYIGFRMKSDSTAIPIANTIGITGIGESYYPPLYRSFLFDSIGIYGYIDQEYESNVVQINTEVSSDGESVDVTIGEYDAQSTDKLKEIEERISQLEEVQVSD